MTHKQYLVVLSVDKSPANLEHNLSKYNLVIAFANGPMRNTDGSINDVMMQSSSYDCICNNLKHTHAHQFWNQVNDNYAGLFSEKTANKLIHYYNHFDFDSHAKKYTVTQFKKDFKWIDVNNKNKQHDNNVLTTSQIKHLRLFKQPLNDRYIVISAVDTVCNNFVCAASYYDCNTSTTNISWRNDDGSFKNVSLDNNHSYQEICKHHDYWFSYNDAKKLQNYYAYPFNNHIQIYNYKDFVKRFAYMKYIPASSKWNTALDNIKSNENFNKKNSRNNNLRLSIQKLKYLDRNFNNLSLHDIHSSLATVINHLNNDINHDN